MLDGLIDKEMFDEKVQEIDDTLKQLDYKVNMYAKEFREIAEYEDKVKKFRHLLLDNDIVETFDRSLFESVIQSVVVGSYDDNGKPDPAIVTFIYKTGICDEKKLEDCVLREKDNRQGYRSR